jgi:hypothetical protein
MAIHVYKEGNKHTVNGIKCEIVSCVDVADMNHQIANGCVHNEKELYAEKKESEEVSLHPVRIAARDAGLDNWETARIKTLEAALNGTTEG